MAYVRVSEGVLEGAIVQNRFGESYYSFKGIPYALPPLGDLRFKAPQPPKRWLGMRKATEFGPICFQIDLFKKTPPSGSEDCLYLNVYSPNIKPDKPLPVMFWIHGGAYTWGSGNDDFYGPDFLVREDIILVTFNYRLEVLGFLCLDTEDAPGNAAMKDQVAALRWVNKNISNFGGDPKNVTIFGESAGGGSVGYHLVSPMTKGLFKRAILQSGTSGCWWAQTYNPLKDAIGFAKRLGFVSDDPKELYEFYKTQPIKSLILTNAPSKQNKEDGPADTGKKFTIVSEKKFGDNERFFYGNVDEELRNNIHDGVEVLAGYVEEEYFGILGIMGLHLIPILMKAANESPEFFVPKKVAAKCPKHLQQEVGKKMKEYYLKGETISMNNIDKMVKFLSCDSFVYEVAETLKFSAKKNKTYSYKFTSKSNRNIYSKYVYQLEKVFGDRMFACHCDDLGYMFEANYVKQEIDKDSREFKLIEQVTKLWTNFAKFGNPTPNSDLGVVWPEYSVKDKHYLDIGEQLIVGTAPDGEEIKFWDNIIMKYVPKK